MGPRCAPPVEQVRPGLWSIPVPIPNNPLRYVLVYLFELDNGVALVDAGWNTDEAWQALNDGLAAGRRQHRRRPGGRGHPHPPRPLRPGRPGARGLGGLGRPAPGRRRPAPGPLRRHRRAGRPDESSCWRSRASPTTSGPTWPTPRWRSARWSRWPSPTSCLEDDQKLDLAGWDLRTIWTPGPLPRPHLPLQRPPAAPAVGRPRAAADHPQHLLPHPAGRQPARRLPRVPGPAARPSTPTRSCPPTSTASPVSTTASTTSWPTTSDRLDEIHEIGAGRTPGVLGLGHHPVARVVPALGRDPGLHAAGGQRRDPGPPGAARAPRTGCDGSRRWHPRPSICRSLDD